MAYITLQEALGEEALITKEPALVSGLADNVEDGGLKAMLGLLATLRAMVWEYYTSHWVVKGFTFYGNHLLFTRLYEQVLEEVDAMAEKIVGVSQGDVTGLNVLSQMDVARSLLASIDNIECRFERGLKLEGMLLDGIVQAKQMVEAAGMLTPGIENMLDDLYDSHEGHVYLIQQTLK